MYGIKLIRKRIVIIIMYNLMVKKIKQSLPTGLLGLLGAVNVLILCPWIYSAIASVNLIQDLFTLSRVKD